MKCTAESCREGLTPRCFEECPKWAKRAFAYRLLHMLAPGKITKRLQKGLGEALIAPGVDIPPGITLPPGFDPNLPPDIVIPPGGIVPPVNITPDTPGPPHRPSPPPSATTYEVTFTAHNDGPQGCNEWTWADARDATSGNVMYMGETELERAMFARQAFTMYNIARSFFDFDLSSIPAAAAIVSCTLDLQNYGSETCNVIVQQGTQSDSLGMDDYDAFTGSYFDLNTWILNINTFEFNAAGLTYIASVFGSTAKLCTREYDHDYVGPAPGMSESYQAGLYYSGTADPDNKPKLTVTYKY